MKLKRQGFFREMPHGNKNDPSIFQFIQEKSGVEEDKIYRYLNEGIILAACGGIVNDIINPENGVIGCPDVLTDGFWVWPGDLPYYVKKYHLALDGEFIKTMKSNNWIIKSMPNIDYDNLEIM